jgi:putative salt-induced outer membrane protein
MKIKTLFCLWLACALTAAASAHAAPVTGADKYDGFHHESEAGVVLTSGNSDTQNYNLTQATTYGWGTNLATFSTRYLKGFARGQETARFWLLGLRFDRSMNARIGYYTGYILESDIFAGYDSRHNFDAGGKYSIVSGGDTDWSAELGYRYLNEKQIARGTKAFQLGRAFTQVKQPLREGVSVQAWIEYLHNFTVTDDFLLNTEASLTAALSSVFSFRTSYLLRYRNVPAKAGATKTDKTLTTAIVASF